MLQGMQEQNNLIFGWWSNQMFSGGVVVNLSVTLVCSNPSLHSCPIPEDGAEQSVIPELPQPWAADLLSYYLILLVLLTAAAGALGHNTSWSFSCSRGLKDTNISSMHCSIIVISCYHLVVGTKSIKCGKVCHWSSLTYVYRKNREITFYRG